MIPTRTLPTGLPVLMISDIQRFRAERDYVEALVANLLEYVMDSDNLRGPRRTKRN
jgi:hypothetical protein